MVSRITLGVRGLPEYLENGIKSGSTLTREEKDTRIQIDGSIDALKDSIEFCQSKGWKNSYYHITLSFKHEEWEKIESAICSLCFRITIFQNFATTRRHTSL